MKTPFAIAITIAITLLFGSLARAEMVQITPIYGYRFGGGVQDSRTGAEINFKDAPAYGLIMDVGSEKSEMKLELLWTRQDTSLHSPPLFGLNDIDVSIDEIQVGAKVELGKNRFRQYLAGDVGATYFSAGSAGSDTRFSFGLGGGLKFFVTKNIEVLADLRGFCTILDSEGSFITHNGVTVIHYSASSMWQGQASIGVGVAF